jgi:hypothetical protein
MTIIARGIPDTNFLHEKQFKCSLTGLTRMKEGRYRNRYQVSPGYAVTAKGEIIRKPKTAQPKPQARAPITVLPSEKKERKSTYSVAKQIIRNRMRAMVNMMHVNTDRMRRPKLYFFTVTFLEGLADDICYQVYNTWLTELRQRGLLLSYLWVAERQQNGTVHFHIAIPHYLNVHKANRVMRRVLVDQKNKGNLPGWERMKLMRYNGVHISKNSKTGRPVNFAARGKQKALSHYLTKYITKNNTAMHRLAWHCSRDWSALVVGMAFTRKELGTFVKAAMIDLNSLHTKYVEFFRWQDYKPPDKIVQHLGRLNYDILHHVTESDAILFTIHNN